MTTGRAILSFISQSRKLLPALMAAALLLNTLSPRACAVTIDENLFVQALEAQPLLQYYYSITVLPVTIVNKLLGNPAQKGGQRPDNGASKRADSAAGFALTPQVKIIENAARPLAHLWQALPGMTLPAALRCSRFIGSAGKDRGSGPALPFILLFLIALRRSSLPASARTIFLCQ